MAREAPTNPFIIVIGATGTGKSKLAVELASRFNGEIINGDAMQMYDGLPIITNKITVEERKGIPHHLLGIIGLDEEPWRVSVFNKKARELIKEIRSRGRLPILVGGTHYYTQSLLFNMVVENAVEDGDGAKDEISREEINRRFPILERPTREILEELEKVDPVMANRWHPNDRRKLQRSLEIYLLTGKRASQIYQEQREKTRLSLESDTKSHASRGQESEVALRSTLIFWIHAESEILKSRLDTRVEEMIDRGLIGEATSLRSFVDEQTAAEKKIDLSSGIWISIGFKEFERYITSKSGNASGEALDILLKEGIKQTKAATRHYARRQIRWIRMKLLSALSSENLLDSLYLFDGTDLGRWQEMVSDQASGIVGQFLAGEKIPEPRSLSPAAGELLVPGRDFELSDRWDLWTRQVCDVCDVTAVTEEQWQIHLKGRGHRRAVKRSKNGLQDKVAIIEG